MKHNICSWILGWEMCGGGGSGEHEGETKECQMGFGREAACGVKARRSESREGRSGKWREES
jgi:hypothetical protein